MSIYFDYLSDYERSIMIESVKFNNEFDKLQTLYEMTNLHLSQLEREAEHKVFAESGSYDDFAYLLQEAGEEALQQKQNILQKIVALIKSFFDKITGRSKQIKSSELPPDTMINVPEEAIKQSSIITSAVDKMGEGFTRFASGDIGGAFNIFKNAIVPVSIVSITGAVTYKQISKRYGEQISDKMKATSDKLKGWWDQITTKIPLLKSVAESDLANKCMHPIKTIMSAIDSICGSIDHGVQSASNGNKGNQKKKPNNKNKNNAQNVANEERSRLLAKNNVLEKPDQSGGKYVIDRTTGEITHVDANGNLIENDKTPIPRHVVQAAQHLKGKAAAQAQSAKQQADQRNEVNSRLASAKTFTPEQTGVKVFVDPTTARLVINGKSVMIPENYSTHKAIKFLKQNGVTKNHKAILDAVTAAHQGIVWAKNKQMAIDAEQETKERQLRQESVCDLMNQILDQTVFEAVIEDDHISIVEYSIDIPTISGELIQALESEGYTVVMTDTTYEIYE